MSLIIAVSSNYIPQMKWFYPNATQGLDNLCLLFTLLDTLQYMPSVIQYSKLT